MKTIAAGYLRCTEPIEPRYVTIGEHCAESLHTAADELTADHHHPRSPAVTNGAVFVCNALDDVVVRLHGRVRVHDSRRRTVACQRSTNVHRSPKKLTRASDLAVCLCAEIAKL